MVHFDDKEQQDLIEHRYKAYEQKTQASRPKEEQKVEPAQTPQEWSIKGPQPVKQAQLTRQGSSRLVQKADQQGHGQRDGRKVDVPATKEATERELMTLNLELSKYKGELSKIENAKIKNVSNLKQKREIESKIDSLSKRIDPLKTSLRKKPQ